MSLDDDPVAGSTAFVVPAAVHISLICNLSFRNYTHRFDLFTIYIYIFKTLSFRNCSKTRSVEHQETRLLREARLRAAAEKDRDDGAGLDAVCAKDLRSLELHRCGASLGHGEFEGDHPQINGRTIQVGDFF